MQSHEKAQVVPRDYIEMAASGATISGDTACPVGTRALLIGVAGDIVVTINGHDVTLAVSAGLLLGYFSNVKASGSTVTGIWAVI